MRFHIRTYGCQMNERDSEAMGALLEREGHARSRGERDADVVIVNTCAVRGKAEDKALGKLGLLAAWKREAPGRRVGAAGCVVQRLGGGIFERVPCLDFAVGTHRLHLVAGALARAGRGEPRVLEAGEGAAAGGPAGLDRSGRAPGAVSAFVNILHGCDRGCSYCVVPRVRGPERSRPGPEIVEEIRRLVRQGTREVVLLGQSVMSYGRRGGAWPEGWSSGMGFTEPLPRLLEAVSALEGVSRIRFTSGHPSGCTPELARAMRDLPAVCEHMHMPLQSGSDRILDRMRRGYTADDYRRAAAELRRAVPDIALSTDVIVGFPSETPEDFDMTRRFMEEMAFDSAFVFKYSARPDTPAAGWCDDVPAGEKMRRNRILLEEQEARSLAIRRGLEGAAAEVLVEGVSLRNPLRWSGRTRHNRTAVFRPVGPVRPGDIVRVRVTRATAQTLYGEVEEQGGRSGREAAR